MARGRKWTIEDLQKTASAIPHEAYGGHWITAETLAYVRGINRDQVYQHLALIRDEKRIRWVDRAGVPTSCPIASSHKGYLRTGERSTVLTFVVWRFEYVNTHNRRTVGEFTRLLESLPEPFRTTFRPRFEDALRHLGRFTEDGERILDEIKRALAVAP